MSKPLTEVAISAYNAICKVPQIVAGRFVSAPSFATIDFKQRCLPTGEFENYQLTANFTAEKAENMCQILGQPLPTGKNVLFVSPSGNKQISLKTSTTDPKQQFFLYWNANRLEHTIDLKALDLHQQVVAKTPFQAASWSQDERYFFYLAERKQPKTKSFFDQKPDQKAGDEVVPGNENKYIEDWGEQLTGISKTIIGVFDSFSMTVNVLNYDGGEDKCVTKVLANPENIDQIYLILHHIRPFRIGLIYCTQRRSDLVCLTNWNQFSALKVTPVSTPDQELAILDASVSPDGKRIVWFQCMAGGPHNRAFELWTANAENVATSRRQVTSSKTCPIFFDHQGAFVQNCWLSDRALIVQSFRHSKSIIQEIDIDSSLVRNITIPPAKSELASFNLLDVSRNKCLLILESSVNSAPAFLVGTLKDGTFSFRRFAPFLVDDTFLETGITWSLKSTMFSTFECQYIVVSPKNTSSPVPLVVIPHGGPHSAFNTAFAEIAAAFAFTGFGVVMINYPGSIGFDSVEALPGNIGTLDVESVQHCVKDCLATGGNFDKNNVFMFGGSHGGFLALRLIAGYPDFYRACACRNPVSDLAQMVGVSDIPDWVFVECGLQPSLSGFITLSDITKPEVLAKMNEQSPARFVDRIKCPLLMALGRNDRRVPMSQGLNFCRMLKQQNPQLAVEIFSYEDDHSLNSVKVHSDVFVNVAQWFNKFIK